MLLLIVVLLQAAMPAPQSDTIITVTGTRMSDLAGAVDACKTAPCPTRVDIVASVRYAEALFRGGRYIAARTVLRDAVDRNKSAAKVEPMAVSQLYYALANLSAHEGDQREHAQTTWASFRILRDAYPANAPEVLIADLRVADLKLRGSDPRGAIDGYRDIARRADANGQPGIAAGADLHRANALHALGQRRDAAALLAQIAARPGPALAPIRQAALAMAAAQARRDGDKPTSERLVALLLAMPPGPTPQLLWEPPAPKPTDPVYRDGFTVPVDTTTRSGDIFGLGWIDIGFWIRSDGSVESAEILRGSHDPAWAPALVKMVAGRRYTPFATADGSEGQYRIERFTLTADYDVPIGSQIRRRVRNPRFERLDLTETPRQPASTGASGQQ